MGCSSLQARRSQDLQQPKMIYSSSTADFQAGQRQGTSGLQASSQEQVNETAKQMSKSQSYLLELDVGLEAENTAPPKGQRPRSNENVSPLEPFEPLSLARRQSRVSAAGSADETAWHFTSPPVTTGTTGRQLPPLKTAGSVSHRPASFSTPLVSSAPAAKAFKDSRLIQQASANPIKSMAETLTPVQFDLSKDRTGEYHQAEGKAAQRCPDSAHTNQAGTFKLHFEKLQALTRITSYQSALISFSRQLAPIN